MRVFKTNNFLVVTIVASVVISNLNTIEASVTSKISTCNDFTIDKCHIEPGGLLETVKDISIDNCQFYCNIIYKDLCTFFIYDRKEVLCQLIQEPFDNYVQSCSKYGGPKNPTISECYDSNDGCKVINVQELRNNLNRCLN